MINQDQREILCTLNAKFPDANLMLYYNPGDGHVLVKFTDSRNKYRSVRIDKDTSTDFITKQIEALI